MKDNFDKVKTLEVIANATNFICDTLKQYMEIGSVDKCREAVEKQNAYEPKYLGEDAPVGYIIGMCKCGTVVKSYQNYCDNCGNKLLWNWKA